MAKATIATRDANLDKVKEYVAEGRVKPEILAALETLAGHGFIFLAGHFEEPGVNTRNCLIEAKIFIEQKMPGTIWVDSKINGNDVGPKQESLF